LGSCGIAHGWIKVKAEFYPGIRPDTVMVLHGWWQGCKELGFKDFPLLDGGANVNIMYSVDPAKAFDPWSPPWPVKHWCK